MGLTKIQVDARCEQAQWQERFFTTAAAEALNWGLNDGHVKRTGMDLNVSLESMDGFGDFNKMHNMTM